MKIDQYEISNWFEFHVCLHEKSYRDGQKIIVCNSLVKLSLFILKTNMAKKIVISRYITTSITYKLCSWLKEDIS